MANMMTTKILLVPGIINSNSVKMPIPSMANNNKLTRYRTNPRRFYTAYERKVLFQCIKKYRSESEKGPNSKVPSSNSLPWALITDDFNSRQGIRAANSTQLSNLYRNIIRKKKNEISNRLKTVVKVEPKDDGHDESNPIQISDVVWADDSTKQMSSEDESEAPSGVESESIEENSRNTPTNTNLPPKSPNSNSSKSATSSPSQSNLMKASSKAAEAFVELLNIAEPATETNVLILKQKEEEHELKMSFLAQEHSMKMMVLQAKLDYYRTLRERAISLTNSKKEA